MTPPTWSRNEWGGLDAIGPHGLARWMREDGRRVIVFLEGDARTLAWSATVTVSAPQAAFLAVWAAALISAGVSGPTETHARVRAMWACGGHEPETAGVVCGDCHQAEVDRLMRALDSAVEVLNTLGEQTEDYTTEWFLQEARS